MNFIPAAAAAAASSSDIDPTRSNATPLNELSMEERESGIHDLHGVSDIPSEDGDFLERALTGLRKEINLKESITADDRELLKFLRAENFNASKAAARYNRFLAFQEKLFVGKKPNKRRLLSELDEEDKKMLQSGFLQLLQQKDNAGRSIIICLGAMREQLKTSLDSDVGIKPEKSRFIANEQESHVSHDRLILSSNHIL